MFRSYLKHCYLVCCLLASMLAHAQHAHVLEEIVVTADPLGQVEGHLVQPVDVLTKDELKTRSIRNIGETIANEPGVTSSDFGSGSGRPIIRGQAGSRVSVLENGISTMDVANLSADHAVPVETVSATQVEIFRGPATLMFGSGASGGVVNVVNDRILRYVPESPEGDISIQYETVSDGLTAGGSLNFGSGNFAFHLDGMVRDTDDYDIPGFAELVPDEPGQGTLENSSVETENFAAGLSYNGESGFAGFAVSRYTHDYGIPGHHHEEEGDEEEEGGIRIDMEQTRYDFEASLDEPIEGIKQIKTRWSYNDYEHNEVEPGGQIGTAFDNDEVEGRIEFKHNLITGWDGVIGIQYRNKDFSAIGEEGFVPPSDLESLGVFILEKRDFGRWHIDMGARYEHQDTEADTGADSDHDLFSISGGLGWDYTDGYQLGFSLTHAQRAPSIEELYANGPHLATTTFEIGNADLGKEKSTNIDIFWRKTGGFLTFTANFFYNKIDDYIFREEQDLNNDGAADRVEEDFDGDPADILAPGADEEPLLVFLSQDDADFFGFELEGVFHVLEEKQGTLDIRLWADYVEGERSNNINLPRITPWRFGTGLDYSLGPWFASLAYTRVNKQDDTAPLETATNGYDLLNIHAGYTFKLAVSDITLFASVTNLFDEEIRRHTSFVKEIAPLPGLSGVFGISASF